MSVTQTAPPSVAAPWYARPGVVTVVAAEEAARWFGYPSARQLLDELASSAPSSLCAGGRVDVSALPLDRS